MNQAAPPTRLPRRRLATLLLSATSLILAVGCASYRFGSDALFPANLRTVYIPAVRNETFRHEIGPQLHEAIVREVQLQTPYTVVGHPGADSILRCTVTAQSKVILTESASDDPRALDAAVSVAANWTTRDGRRLMQNSIAMLDADSIGFSQSQRLVPEAGQSIQSALQESVDQLAKRIVSQMEARW
ncbi:MAG: LPS assembly lipoprotein LptE [Planctomycetota bacterium]